MQNCLFCTLLALFAAFSLTALYKRSQVQIPNGPASNLKLTLCQPSSCMVYFSKHGDLNSVKGEERASSFIFHDQGVVNS